MRFPVDYGLLAEASTALARMDGLYWILGGAGAGKTTVCRLLASRFAIPVYDMDAHIYGEYHGRFTDARHPINRQWLAAPDGLGWQLAMPWEEFDGFGRAALPEYLDLLAGDVAAVDSRSALLVDGGVWHPSLLAQVLTAKRIVCLAATESPSTSVWEQSDDRRAMKLAVMRLPEPEGAWRRFLEFDARITAVILEESREHNIRVVWRNGGDSPGDIATRVADALGLAAG